MNNLVENGFVFLKDVYKDEILNKINQEFYYFYKDNNIQEHLAKREDVKKDTYYVNNTYNILNSYHKQQFYYLPVIDNRFGHNRVTDNGVIDIFNVNKLLPSINENINVDIILEILYKLTNKSWKLERINLQINNNVTHTNNYHYDDNNNIKFTIYMNTIKEEYGGGLSFIEKTHINKKFKNNQIKNFYGNTGDVLISYQNGLHKKIPQQNSINYFLVYNFNTKD
jgi:hypothetical protein